MTTTEIRDLIAKARTERAVQAALEITAATDLESAAISVSTSYRKHKRNTISGILSTAEERQEHALITNRLLELLNEYEIIQVKSLKNSFDKLKDQLEQESQTPEIVDTLNQLEELNTEFDEITRAESKEEIKPTTIGKIGQFLEKFKDPNTNESKVIKGIKGGVGMAQDLAKLYNSIAEWLALPQVPRLFLKKD